MQKTPTAAALDTDTLALAARPCPISPGVVEFSEEAIAEIVFGCNPSTHDVATVKRILGGPEWKNVEFKRVQFTPLSFELELVPA